MDTLKDNINTAETEKMNVNELVERLFNLPPEEKSISVIDQFLEFWKDTIKDTQINCNPKELLQHLADIVQKFVQLIRSGDTSTYSWVDDIAKPVGTATGAESFFGTWLSDLIEKNISGKYGVVFGIQAGIRAIIATGEKSSLTHRYAACRHITLIKESERRLSTIAKEDASQEIWELFKSQRFDNDLEMGRILADEGSIERQTQKAGEIVSRGIAGLQENIYDKERHFMYAYMINYGNTYLPKVSDGYVKYIITEYESLYNR